MTHTDPLVSTAWLASTLGAPDLVVLDGSWYLPGSGRDPDAEHREGHLPGAVRLDLDRFSDPDAAVIGGVAAEKGRIRIDDEERVRIFEHFRWYRLGAGV